MIFLGLDPGTATTGYGVVETQGMRRLHLAHGAIRTPYGLPPGERLKMIHEALVGLFRRWRPDVVAMEELFFSSNVTTAIAVAQAQGVILLTATQAGLRLIEFPPHRVKQTVTQDGRASKRDVQHMIMRLLALSDVPQPDDAADALAIALCATQETQWNAPLARSQAGH